MNTLFFHLINNKDVRYRKDNIRKYKNITDIFSSSSNNHKIKHIEFITNIIYKHILNNKPDELIIGIYNPNGYVYDRFNI